MFFRKRTNAPRRCRGAVLFQDVEDANGKASLLLIAHLDVDSESSFEQRSGGYQS